MTFAGKALAALGWLMLAHQVAASNTTFSLEQSSLRAQVTAAQVATLSASMTGKIASLVVQEGDLVQVGDALVAFDCSIEKAKTYKALSVTEKAQNVYAANQGMASRHAIGQVELRNSEIDVDIAKAEQRYLLAVTQRCEIVAPFTGYIGDKFVQQNEFVNTGDQLFELIGNQQLLLEFIVPSNWVSWFKPGYALTVQLDDNQKKYTAKLQRTAAKVDPLSRSVKAYAILDGQYGEILPGMSGVIHVKPPQ